MSEYLWSCRRDYLDAEQWQQSSFVIGPRNDKDFVGHPSITPLISTPFLFPFLFPPFRHTVCLSLIIPPLRGGPNGITCWQLHAHEFHRSLSFFFFFFILIAIFSPSLFLSFCSPVPCSKPLPPSLLAAHSLLQAFFLKR